jgi:hypothetical protein
MPDCTTTSLQHSSVNTVLSALYMYTQADKYVLTITFSNCHIPRHHRLLNSQALQRQQLSLHYESMSCNEYVALSQYTAVLVHSWTALRSVVLDRLQTLHGCQV